MPYFNENNILRSLNFSLSLFCISVCISDLVFLNGQTLQKADGRRDLEDITGKQLIWPGTRKTLIRPAESARKGWFFRFGQDKFCGRVHFLTDDSIWGDLTRDSPEKVIQKIPLAK